MEASLRHHWLDKLDARAQLYAVSLKRVAKDTASPGHKLENNKQNSKLIIKIAITEDNTDKCAKTNANIVKICNAVKSQINKLSSWFKYFPNKIAK